MCVSLKRFPLGSGRCFPVYLVAFVSSSLESKITFDIHTIEDKFFDFSESMDCTNLRLRLNNDYLELLFRKEHFFSSNFYTFNRKKSFVFLREYFNNN